MRWVLAVVLVLCSAASAGAAVPAPGDLTTRVEPPVVGPRTTTVTYTLTLPAIDADRTYRIDIGRPRLAPGGGEPIGSPLGEVAVLAVGALGHGHDRISPLFGPGQCVAGGVDATAASTVTVRAGTTATLVLHYEVLVRPASGGLGLRLAVRTDGWDAPQVYRPAPALAGRGVPLVQLDEPGRLADGRLRLRGRADPLLAGQRVRFRVRRGNVGDVRRTRVAPTAPRSPVTVASARIGTDGRFAATWRSPFAGYHVVRAVTPAGSRVLLGSSCARQLFAARRSSAPRHRPSRSAR